MNNLQTNFVEQRNIFNIPAPYSNDIWNICEWDYYKKAPKRNQNAWLARSNVMKNTLDFTLCSNSVVAEEIKHFFWKLLNEVTLRTFAEYMDRYKLLVKYVNEHPVNSVCDIKLGEYQNYIVSTNHKAKTDNGKTLRTKELVDSKKTNRLISFLQRVQDDIYNYYESLKPIWERDKWNFKEIDPSVINDGYLHFETITQKAMKAAIKNYIRFRLNDIKIGSTKALLSDIKFFTAWLEKEKPQIKHFFEVDRNILEEYFHFLRLESNLSQTKINVAILNLHTFFDYGLLSENPEFPNIVLFTSNDYAFKTKRRCEYYSDEELEIIFTQIVPKLPKVYGKIFLFLLLTGMRISEVLYLTEDSLCATNGKYYLDVYMTKTHKHNHIPINDTVLKFIEKEIAINKKKYPMSKYIFLNSEGNPISYSTFRDKVCKVIVQNDIRGINAEIFDFKSHNFRSTKATKLINIGTDPYVAADMLGQSTLSALSYYAVATNQSLQEEMQAYIKKQSILINNIGKIDSLVIEDYKNAIPLCNGWCCRPQELGICDKIEACLSCPSFKPSAKYLINYKMQLSDTEASLQIAINNGYTKMAEKCKQQIQYLNSIIEKLEGKNNEQKS